MNDRFNGKVALVTGAASGIGREVAVRLAREGARVACVDLNSDRLAETVEAASTERAIALTCDVSDADAVDATVAAAVAQLGAINILVNSAGVADPNQRRLHEIPLDAWDKVQNVNVRGLFLMKRAVIPHMLDNGGGAIVNLASVASFRATPRAGSYVTSKGAVLTMTRAAAIDYAKDNIRVNAVCPGTINTDILANASEDVMQMLVARAPQGRLGEPEEVASLIAFLVSDEARHINGGSYLIDGGRCAGG
ncbi:SDR family oxidoreductase [Sphingobium sp. JS3065]|uniref:SDR family NAD(P)-dependent oxidoreductase n=1 Tax=Sphingobium sp. JS3065 TaxID=2970925 RepID=UPI0022648FB6|nr:SDR family oxidoreductase [Sphingobium sp. JS3065]UZW57381.1 SDR family oxidoreductase [Sphingobium sp. JS3065]